MIFVAVALLSPNNLPQNLLLICFRKCVLQKVDADGNLCQSSADAVKQNWKRELKTMTLLLCLAWELTPPRKHRMNHTCLLTLGLYKSHFMSTSVSNWPISRFHNLSTTYPWYHWNRYITWCPCKYNPRHKNVTVF